MRLIDTHCHLVSEPFQADPHHWIEAAAAAGVHKIINIAYDMPTVEIMLAQLKLSPKLYGAAGIQPHDAQQYTEESASRISTLAKETNRIVAIGEIGLDGYYKHSPMDLQIPCFEHFLNVALETHLPVIVHVRESHDLVYPRLKAFSARGGTGVIHCFTGTTAEAAEFLDLGFYISMAGIVTFKNALDLKETAAFIPNDRILIETDSPYLSPIPVRGKLNQPAHVLHTCNAVALLRNTPAEEFAELTSQNAETLFARLN